MRIRKRFPGSYAIGLKWIKENFIEIYLWKRDIVINLKNEHHDNPTRT